MPRLTHHRIGSRGDILTLLRKQSATVLDSIEFDVSVGRDADGRMGIEIGHPTELRKRTNEQRRLTPPERRTAEFLELLKKLQARQLVIDVKAQTWNEEMGRAEFLEGERAFLIERLREIIREYQSRPHQAIETNVVVASNQPEIFGEPERERFGENVQTRLLARLGRFEDPFAEAKTLGVDQIGIMLNERDPIEPQLQEIKEQHEAHENVELTFSVTNERGTLEAIRHHFPDTEVITDRSQEFEERETRIGEPPEHRSRRR